MGQMFESGTTYAKNYLIYFSTLLCKIFDYDFTIMIIYFNFLIFLFFSQGERASSSMDHKFQVRKYSGLKHERFN